MGFSPKRPLQEKTNKIPETLTWNDCAEHLCKDPRFKELCENFGNDMNKFKSFTVQNWKAEQNPQIYKCIQENHASFQSLLESGPGTPEPVEATAVAPPSPEAATAFGTPEPVEATAVATTFGPEFCIEDLAKLLEQSPPDERVKKGCDYLDHYFKVVNGKQVVQLTYNDKGKRVGHNIHTITEARALLVKNKVNRKNLMDAFVESSDYTMFRSIEFNPANSQPENVINTFYGLQGQSHGAPRSKEGLNFMLQHLEGLCGGDQWQFDVILDILAYPIQFHGLKSDIALLVVGTTGCGKGMFFNEFIGGKVYGDLLYHKVTGKVGNFNAKLADKMYIVIDEVNKLSHSAIQDLKDAITCTKRDFNEKHKIEFTAKDFANYVILSNDNTPKGLVERNDRRMFCVEASDTFKNNKEHFLRLGREIENEGTASAFYRHLKKRTIKYIGKGTEAPMTALKKRLLNQDIDPVFLYFAHLIETNALPEKRVPGEHARAFKPEEARRMKLKDFFDDLVAYCRDHRYPKPRNVPTVRKTVDALFSGFYGEVQTGWLMFKKGQVVSGEPPVEAIFYPEPKDLESWLDRANGVASTE